jgi:hypothetical protein
MVRGDTNQGGGFCDLSYHFSLVRFYENGIDRFGFLNNIFTMFDGD